MKRVLTAAALIPPVIAVVLFANQWIFFAVVALVALICYHEFDAIAAKYGFGAPGPIGYGAGLALLLWQNNAWILILVVALVALALVLRADDLAHALPRASLLVMGVVYVFGAWKCALPLRASSPHWLMYALIVNWAGDIGAFYAGRAFGRRRLAERVSPKKSQEGAVAAVVTSIVIAGSYLLYFLPSVGVLEAILLTAAANIAGQLGDLCESAMKRGAGVKDSGTILPGHGGFLDRVDSTLFALPVIYGFVLWRAQGF